MMRAVLDHVRLGLYCPTCLPGYHLPVCWGIASGVFADHGLEVTLLEPVEGGGGASAAARVALGGAELCLTGVTYHLFAYRDALAEGRTLPARFVGMLHQRSALSAVFPAGAPIHTAADLVGRRVARSSITGWLAVECAAAMAEDGLGRPEIVPVPATAPEALAAGEVDFMATFLDASVGVEDKIASPVRTIHVGRDIYGSGLVAADRVPLDLVQRAVAAVAAAFEGCRGDLDRAIALLCERYPTLRPSVVARSWALLEPFVFGDGPVASMTPSRWDTTVAWVSAVHGIPVARTDDLFRPEAAVAGQEAAAAAAR